MVFLGGAVLANLVGYRQPFPLPTGSDANLRNNR